MKAYLSRSRPRTDMSERDSDSVPGWEARFPLVPVGCGFPDPPDPDEEEDTGGGPGDKRGPEERDSARESRDSLDTLDVSELFTLFSIVSHSFLGDNKPESREKELVRRIKIISSFVPESKIGLFWSLHLLHFYNLTGLTLLITKDELIYVVEYIY